MLWRSFVIFVSGFAFFNIVLSSPMVDKKFCWIFKIGVFRWILINWPWSLAKKHSLTLNKTIVKNFYYSKAAVWHSPVVSFESIKYSNAWRETEWCFKYNFYVTWLWNVFAEPSSAILQYKVREWNLLIPKMEANCHVAKAPRLRNVKDRATASAEYKWRT